MINLPAFTILLQKFTTNFLNLKKSNWNKNAIRLKPDNQNYLETLADIYIFKKGILQML